MTEATPTASQTATPQVKKGPRGEVNIFPNWCKGCTLCVEFCPTHVLAFIPTQEYPVVAHPEKCTACHWCDTHCPDMAIVVRKLA